MSGSYPAAAYDIKGRQLSLTSTFSNEALLHSTQQILLYSPSQPFRMTFCPALIKAVFYDASATSGARWLDTGSTSHNLANDLTDGSSLTGTGTLMDSMATGDALYLNLSDKVKGLYIDVKSANGNAAVGTLKYYKSDHTWADTSETDGTISTGKTLAVDGPMAFTMPTDWISSSPWIMLNDKTSPYAMTLANSDAPRDLGFWLQWTTGAALDSDTEIQEIIPMARDTSYGFFQAGREYALSVKRSQVGALELDLAAGTATLDLTEIRCTV